MGRWVVIPVLATAALSACVTINVYFPAAEAKEAAKEFVEKVTHKKDRVVAPEEYRRREEAAKDTSESAAREREVLAEEERQREENEASVQILQKLHITPREPPGQRGGGDGEEQTATAAKVSPPTVQSG